MLLSEDMAEDPGNPLPRINEGLGPGRGDEEGEEGEGGRGARTSIDPIPTQRWEIEDEADGPIVERNCPKCGYGRMSYAALQLRSADEGQTVFFTCLKCKHKESENS